MNRLISTDRCVLFQGDSASLDEVLNPTTVDAIICDPPAGISFMGKGWDDDKGGRDAWIKWLAETMAPAFHALKPGGHALVWALPRTSHWTATALENIGFEIRDVVMHLFGTGFPKSVTSKSADIPQGAGTALKPAAEHWILCRKPLVGTLTANYAQHGTGVLQIEACRIETEEDTRRNAAGGDNGLDSSSTFKIRERRAEDQEQRTGRWPAHVTLDEEAAAVLDAQSGDRPDGVAVKRNLTARKHDGPSFGMPSRPAADIHRGGSGGASRFFYVAKGSRAEKDAGCEHLPPRTGGEATDREDGSAGLENPRAGAGRTGGARNHHPTVKSIALMRWLVRLITPPGGVVLDPFAGSGTTGVAALAEGFDFIGCEQSAEYAEIAKARLEHALK